MSSSSPIAPSAITVSHNANVTLRVTEYTKLLTAGGDGLNNIKKITDFHVNREFLSGVSPFFKKLLNTTTFAEAGKNIIALEELKPEPLEAVFCGLHHQLDGWQSSLYGEAITKCTMSLKDSSIWDVISYAQRFRIELHTLDDWFALWYNENATSTPDAMLLYPTFQLNHAEGFLATTKSMVYGQIRIEETKVHGHPQLHLPPRVIRKSLIRTLTAASLTSRQSNFALHEDVSEPSWPTSSGPNWERLSLRRGAAVRKRPSLAF